MKLCRKTLVLVLALVMLLGIAPAASAVGTAAYKDVPAGSYYAGHLAELTELGVVNPTADGKFNPNKACTRAEFVTYLWRAAGKPAPKAAAQFTDVAATAAYADAVAWAVEAGVTTGTTATTFAPNATVTRAQMVTFMHRYATAMKMANTDKAADISSFGDVAALPGHSKTTMPWGIAIGMVTGTKENTLNPNGLATHAHAIAFIGRLMDSALTREDLEDAIVATAWAYHIKKAMVQYDSQEVGAVGKYYGGQYLVVENAAPEYGTDDTTINAVCADWICKIYLEALGYEMLGHDPLEATTTGMWLYAENQGDPAVEPTDVDSVLVRWKSSTYTFKNRDGKGNRDLDYGLDKVEYQTAEEARAFMSDWQNNMRAGDVFVVGGHALLYVGNGYILDCSGDKYDVDLGINQKELFGVSFRMQPMSVALDYVDEAADNDDFTLFRPTEFLVQSDDADANGATDGKANAGTDGDLGNDPVKPGFVMPADTKSRMDYPAMEINRTVDISPFGTAASGETVTYSVRVTNDTNEDFYQKYMTTSDPAYAPSAYEDLLITEVVPAGTEFVSATGEYTKSGNTIKWIVDVPAGESVTVSYTVKVTAPIGTTITSTGGYVANIPSNSITNKVGGAKISAEAEKVLADIAAANPNDWRETFNLSRWTSDVDFAERIYQLMGYQLELPTAQEIVDNLFVYNKNKVFPSTNDRYPDMSQTVSVFELNPNVTGIYADVKDMMVSNYWGGYYFFTGYEARQTSIQEFKNNYLEPGDVIVYVNHAAGKVTDTRVMVWGADDSVITIDSKTLKTAVYTGSQANQLLWKAFQQDLYFVLRPTQIGALAANTAAEPVYEAEPEVERKSGPTEKGTTKLDADNLTILQSLEVGDASGSYIKFVGNAYKKMGISLDGIYGSTTSNANVINAVFKRLDKGSSSAIERDYEWGNVDSELARMVIPGYYGGGADRAKEDFDSDLDYVWLDKAASFKLEDLEPGDFIMLTNYADKTSARSYWVLLYQGDGKFLSSVQYPYDDKGEKVGGTIYGAYDFSSGKDAASGLTFKELMTSDPKNKQVWDVVVAFRPAQVFYDINDPSYAPLPEGMEEEEGLTGKSRPLSEENAAKLAALTLTHAENTGVRNAKFGEEIYKLIGLDYSEYTGGQTALSVLKQIYLIDGENLGNGFEYWYELMFEPAEGLENLHSMVVADLQRGTHMTYEGYSKGAPLTADDLQVGDVIYMCVRNYSSYWIGVYQGDGKMLISGYEGADYAGKTLTGNYYYQWDINEDPSVFVKNPTLVAANKAGGNGQLMEDWQMIVVMRPANAYNDINVEAAV